MPPSPALLRSFFGFDRDQRTMLWLALAYAASGLFHLVVWAIDGGPWAGDVSWRKPIVFGLSGAVTTASLAWALGAVPAGPSRRRGVLVYAVTMTVEIALITMQRWRGVASHYNHDTLFDAIVFQVMGVLIVIASVQIALWLRAVMRNRSLDRELHTTVVGGLVLLVAGLVLGTIIAPLGSIGRLADVPQLVVSARALVQAHAVGLHGIQAMMVLALVLPRFVPDVTRRIVLLQRAWQAGLVLVVVLVAMAVVS